MQRTSFGQTLFAVGGSSDAATLMGLPVARTKLLVYTLSGLLAGLAGALNAARLSSGVTIVGVGMELDAISAVVIGGTLLVGGAGSISGTLWGVLLLAVIQNLINQIGSLNSSYQSVVSGGFLIVVVVAQRCLARGPQSRLRAELTHRARVRIEQSQGVPWASASRTLRNGRACPSRPCRTW